MCGRYTITVTLEELIIRYELGETNIPFHQPRYNVAPSQQIPAIIHDGQSNRLGLLKWGLIPSWADDDKRGSSMINARSETVAAKPAFRDSFQRKRCIIPADGFFEWVLTSGGKQPMRIVMKNRSLFSMAAIYDTWIAPDKSKVSSCSILTTTANSVVAPIHDRMPVLLNKQDEQLWLDRSLQSSELLLPLLKPYPAEEMEAYPVSPKVGNARAESPSFIDRHAIEGQLELW